MRSPQLVSRTSYRNPRRLRHRLVHAAHELVNEFFAIAPLAATLLAETVALWLLVATRRVRELEGPQEVRYLFEVRSNCVNLVDEIFHTIDATRLTQRCGDDFIV